MKTYFLSILLGIFSLYSFSAFAEDTSDKSSKSNTSSTNNTNNKVIQITQDDFIEKIFDYKNNTEWKYEGDKPLIIDFYAE